MDCLLRWLVVAAWLHRISRGVVSCGVQVTKFKIRSLLIRSAQIRGVGVLFVPPDPCCTGNNKLLFPVSSSAGVLICTDIRTDCRLKFTGGKKTKTRGGRNWFSFSNWRFSPTTGLRYWRPNPPLNILTLVSLAHQNPCGASRQVGRRWQERMERRLR